jgi:phospholipid/cholesterol/gamma-HCH transport system substrate-binding protein
MTDSAKAFWLGLFIIVALALLGWLILFLKPSFGDGAVILKVHFSNIDNVTEGTRVTFGGKAVGEVVKIKEVADPRKAPPDASGDLYIYELTLEVDSTVKVYSYDEIIFATSGLLGEKSIAIIPKAAPPGAPPPKNITDDILYARSTDKIEQTLNKLTDVADTFRDALQEISSFIESNQEDFNQTLKSLTLASNRIGSFAERATEANVAGKIAQASEKLMSAMSQAENFFTSARQNELVESMSRSFENLAFVTQHMTTGEGTFARLINSDCFYVQFTTVLCQLQAVLEDIKKYGLLYQFDRKWQRQHRSRPFCTEMTCDEYSRIN